MLPYKVQSPTIITSRISPGPPLPFSASCATLHNTRLSNSKTTDSSIVHPSSHQNAPLQVWLLLSAFETLQPHLDGVFVYAPSLSSSISEWSSRRLYSRPAAYSCTAVLGQTGYGRLHSRYVISLLRRALSDGSTVIPVPHPRGLNAGPNFPDIPAFSMSNEAGSSRRVTEPALNSVPRISLKVERLLSCPRL